MPTIDDRYGVIQEEPLWIVFPSNMMIKLKQELIFNSYKTLDGRGANVHIVGGGCITLQYVSNIIIHNIHIHHCYQSGNFFLLFSHLSFKKIIIQNSLVQKNILYYLLFFYGQ